MEILKVIKDAQKVSENRQSRCSLNIEGTNQAGSLVSLNADSEK